MNIGYINIGQFFVVLMIYYKFLYSSLVYEAYYRMK